MPDNEDWALAKAAQDYPSTLGVSGESYRRPPVRKIIEAQLAEFKKQIEIREQLLLKLDEAKGVEEILDLLRKVGV